MAYKAIIAGASGLIGSKLLTLLLNEPAYNEVLILVRKILPLEHKKLTQLVIDFEKLDGYGETLTGHAIFCCLGSTRKKTPDLAVYRKIDYDYPVKLAQLGKHNGVDQYHLVSSLGANVNSSNFYTKMKGEVERDVQKVGLKCLHIYEPSILTGDRTEYRPVERIAGALMKVIDLLLIGGLKKFRSIPAQTVAQAMFNESLKNNEGIFVHLSEKIKLLV